MRSVVNDSNKRKLSMAEEGDRSNDRIVQPPVAEEDHCSSTDVSTLDQASAASGCSCSVDMADSGVKSEEEEEEEEPDNVQLETSSVRRYNSSRGEEEVIEGNDVDLDQSRRRRPAEAELEEFFAAAESESREQKKRLAEKYNFDFDMEKPLDGGRYEWVRLSPMKKKRMIKN